MLFSCCSNVQAARNRADFADALAAVVKELLDVHLYQIQQKFQGGRLQIYIDEINAPGISLLTRWAGGALSPRQLDRLGPEFAELREQVERQFMVLPRKDIILGGSVQDEKKLVAARIVRNFLKRLEKVPQATAKPAASPKGKMAIWLGNVVDPNGRTSQPWQVPLGSMLHTFVSGKTGSGKSFAARVIVEGAAVHKDLAIVILDPGNQWIGLLQPEDRPEILAKYKAFGLRGDQARSFAFAYHGVGRSIGEPLPGDLRRLAHGHRIISFKDMTDAERCDLAADIMNAIFDACARSQSDGPRVLVVTEEAPRFRRKAVGHDGEQAAGRVEQSIDRITREGRQYGVNLLLIGQSNRDFSYSMATVRQNITSRVFMNNSDREVEYAADFIGDGKAIVSLPTGEAFVCNPQWGVAKVVIRPPLSKVWEPDDEETAKLAGASGGQASPRLSGIAQAVLETAWEEFNRDGRPVRLSGIAERLGLSSRRKIRQVVTELTRTSAVRFERLEERGQPLVLVPLGDEPASTNRPEMRT